MAMNKQVAIIASAICFTFGAWPALSQGGVSTDSSATAGDITANISEFTNSLQPMQLTGGLEQKERIAIPANPATADRKALPALILEVPKLGAGPQSIPIIKDTIPMFTKLNRYRVQTSAEAHGGKDTSRIKRGGEIMPQVANSP